MPEKIGTTLAVVDRGGLAVCCVAACARRMRACVATAVARSDPSIARPTEPVDQRFEVEGRGVHDRWLGESRGRRVLLADAAVEDDDRIVAANLSPIAQLGDGGEGRRRFGADVPDPQ